MHVMWWGSILQSLSTELFLALRHSNEYHSAKFYKRLDVSESSTGESSAYTDSWVRTDYFDFGTLLKWCQKTSHDSIVIVDLWGFIASGKDVSTIESQLQLIIDHCGGLIFLLPRMHVAAWYEKLEIEYSGSVSMYSELLRFIDTTKKTYEYLLNSSARFGIIESSIHYRDFCSCVDLDFSKARKFAGLFYLMPRELTRGPLGFTSTEDFCNGIVRMFDKIRDLADSNLLLNLRNTRLESFTSGRSLQQSAPNRDLYSGRALITRRKDGVLALCTNWSLYLSTVLKERSGTSSSSVKLSPLERKFLVFLLQFEGASALSSSLTEESLLADSVPKTRLLVS